MANPEYSSHSPPPPDENPAEVAPRYSPPGNRKIIEKLKILKRLAMFKAAAFDPSVADDIRETFLDDAFAVAEDPATTYQKAIELNKNYGDAIRAEEELANAFLMQFAEQYMTDPPQEQWGIVRGISEDGTEFLANMKVPFIQLEIEAINEAKYARQRIPSSGGIENRAARDFWMDSYLFPADMRIGPLAHSLTNRPRAIWGIMTAARAAEDVLTYSIGKANGPRRDAAKLLITVRDLPDKLIRHRPAISPPL